MPFLLVLQLLLAYPVASQDLPGCTKNSTAHTSIGGRLELESTLDRFSNCEFEWYNKDSQLNETECNDQHICVVAEMVTSVDQVGGRRYRCTCGQQVQCWTVNVKPVVEITFSPPYYVEGIDINVTCSASSYPPADSTKDYVLQHPANERVDDIIHLNDDRDGVVYTIDSANEEDEGEYLCHVTVAELSTVTKKNLTEDPNRTKPPTTAGQDTPNNSSNNSSGTTLCGIFHSLLTAGALIVLGFYY